MAEKTIPNAEMIEHWNGPDVQHWVEEQERYDATARHYGERALEAAAIRPGERVLDVGCGCGETSLSAGRLVGPSGQVVGVDISGPMLARARERAASEGLKHVRFEQADAQTSEFEPGSFDAMISRFGVMFFDDPVAAFTNLRSALREGGRVSFVCWRDLFSNEWMLVPAMAIGQHVPLPEPGDPNAPGPFAFADPERLRSILGAAGFSGVSIDPVDLPMNLGGGLALDEAIEWLQGTNFARSMLKDASPETRSAAIASVREALSPYAGADGVELKGAGWLVTATA